MSIRWIAVGLVVVMAFVAGMLWQKQAGNPQAASQAPSASEASGADAPPGDAPGGPVVAEPTGKSPFTWTPPSRWVDEGDRPMRAATYSIPGGAGAAECAVFYFGPSQGGGVDDNIARWVGQFENAGSPVRATRNENGFTVHRVQVTGDYLAPQGPMMQSGGVRKGYMLIGAIVDDPSGAVFFKLTGPEKTVKSAAAEFDRMLESLRKG